MSRIDDANKAAYDARVGYTASQIVVGFEVVRGAAHSTVTDIWDAIGNEARESGLSPRQARLASTRLARLHDITKPILLKTQNYVAAVSKNEYRIAFYEHAFSVQSMGFTKPLGDPSKDQMLKRFKTYPSVFIDTDYLRADRARVNRTIDRVILNALNQGKSVKQAARDVDVVLGFRNSSGTLTAKGRDMLNKGQKVTPKGEIYKTVRIARTEMSRMNGWADVDAMLRAQSKGFDERLQLVATLDNRTRRQSAEMHLQISNEIGQFQYPDGNHYYKGEAPPQWSINDRETTRPYIDPEILEANKTQEVDGFEITAEFRTWDEFQKAQIPSGVNRYGQDIRI